MRSNTAKENILKKIRQALTHQVPVPFPKSEGNNNSVFQPPSDDLEVEFANEFSKLLGKFAFCIDEAHLEFQLAQLFAERKWKSIYCVEDFLLKLMKKLPGELVNTTNLANCDASVTSCECLIARTGSIVLSAGIQEGRTASVYAPVHICVAFVNQIVYDIKDALLMLREKYGGNLPSMISLATGPSRTADIEKTLVVGVHGPKEVYLFLVDK